MDNATIGDVEYIGGDLPWDGEIKDVRIHNRALEDTEVAAAYNGESTPWKYADAGGTELITTWTNKDFDTFTPDGSDATLIDAWVSGINGDNCYAAYNFVQGKTYRIKVSFASVPSSLYLTIANDDQLSSGGGRTNIKTSGWATANVFEFTPSQNYSHIGFTSTAVQTLPALTAWSFVEIGEVAAYTPRSIDCRTKLAVDYKWLDTTSNANHGAITGATMVGDNDHLGVLVVKGRSEAGDDDANTAGCILLGNDNTKLGRIDYDPAGTTSFRIDNTKDNASAEIEFGLRQAGTRKVPMQLIGDGSVKATSGTSTNLKQVARMHSKTVVVNTGTALAYTVTHNLGTRGIITSAQDSSNEFVEVHVDAATDDTAVFTFANASAVASNENFIFTIMGGGAPEAA
jgi:hypothetical protein